MRQRWEAWRAKRLRIRAWKRYYREVGTEGYRESLGLGHPEWIVEPPFPDPRVERLLP